MNEKSKKEYLTLKDDLISTAETNQLPVDLGTVDQPSALAKEMLASDLKLNLEEVNTYFQYYYLNSRFPIRKLTPDEMSFARTLREVQFLDNHALLSYFARYQITLEEYLADRFLLPRLMTGLEDNDDFHTLIKWRVYLLEPYLSYGNLEAPLLRPLTKMELFLIVSNIASGNSMIPGQKVEIKDQMTAIQKLIDAYAVMPPTQTAIEPETSYEEMSVNELVAAARLLSEQDLRTAAKITNDNNVAAPDKPKKKQTKKTPTKKTTKTTIKTKKEKSK